jgi:hypothetical protein
MLRRLLGNPSMRLSSIALRAAVLGLASVSLSGCLAATVVGAAVGTTAKVASGTVHVGHMAVNAATGGGDKSDKKDGGQ